MFLLATAKRGLAAAFAATALLCAAETGADRRAPAEQGADACLQQAAALHGVNPLILRAIIFHESRDNPNLVMRNTNGSLDIGLGGLNSVHLAELARYGIGKEQLLDGCTNIYVAAWHLGKQVKAYGNTWAAIGMYHSKTPAHRDRYAAQIYAILKRWNAVP